MRLNKFLSDRGVCSRREADRRIEEGRVKINGVVAELGQRVEENDAVSVDDINVSEGDNKPKVYIALHKPRGIECTTHPDTPHNIVDFVGYPERIYPVGRLDKPSEGLILMTNDGELSNQVLKARHFHEKVYIATVDQPITEAFLDGMRSGVPILDTVTRPCEVKKLKSDMFEIILTQGLNRQIRRMCEYFEYKVLRLRRIRVLNIELGDLPVGEWRHLTTPEVEQLKQMLSAPPTQVD